MRDDRLKRAVQILGKEIGLRCTPLSRQKMDFLKVEKYTLFARECCTVPY
jgi:hypothetical protein